MSSVNFKFERTSFSGNFFGLDYGEVHMGAWVKLLLVKVTFVHADAPYLVHQKQCEGLGEKSVLE